MLLKGALHTHSTCSDGEMSVSKVIAAYRELGFDFVALTDHDFLLPERCYEENRRKKSHLWQDMLVFWGVELTVFQRGYVHVNRIRGDEEELHIFNHPSELDLPVASVIERVLAVRESLPLDAIEITTKGVYTPEYDVDAIPLVKVATDDSHTRLGCGKAWVELDGKRAKDAIIRAIKHNDFWNCFS